MKNLVWGLCALGWFASVRPTVAAAVRTPLIECLPADVTLFAFSLTHIAGCLPTPGGMQCGDHMALDLFTRDPHTQRWTSAGGMQVPATEVTVDRAHDEFSYHYRDGETHIDVDKAGVFTRVDIRAPFGTAAIPHVDTRGAQTSYRCTLQ